MNKKGVAANVVMPFLFIIDFKLLKQYPEKIDSFF